jgi:hypothetical protein
MKTHQSTALTCLALMIVSLILAFASCKKSPETIGNNLISENNYIGVYHTDTVEIMCHSYFDSVSTKNTSYALLGSMKDPVFGTSEAGFYSQFRLSLAGQSFGSDPVLDSLVLQLSIANYYGDTNVFQTARVYELTDSLSRETLYYNHSSIEYNPIDHANGFQFRPRPRTAMSIVGTDTIHHAIIRIPLSAALGEYLMNLDSVSYIQPDYFKNSFKGLFVTCDPVSQPGAISSISITDNTNTLLQLYYHSAATPEKPMRYDYYVTSSETYFNHIDHDYTQGSTEFVDQLINGNLETGQQTAYLQTMGGVRTRIYMPNLEHWTDSLDGSYIVVNEAKLVLPVAESSADSVFRLPSNFMLLGFNADSTTYLLPDYYEGDSYFGGTYNSSEQAVVFRISEYLQSIISRKKENHGISFGINGAGYNAYRMIVNGPESPQAKKMHLEVTYSIVNE